MCIRDRNITKGANPIKVAKLVNKIIHLKNPRKKYVSGYGRQVPLPYSSDFDKRDLLNTFGLDKRIQVKDVGANSKGSVDYPDYAHKLSKLILLLN